VYIIVHTLYGTASSGRWPQVTSRVAPTCVPTRLPYDYRDTTVDSDTPVRCMAEDTATVRYT
jgi:hypothetical protein